MPNLPTWRAGRGERLRDLLTQALRFVTVTLVSGYTKLFASIVTSTIWGLDSDARVVWVTMLALADRHGRVEGSVPGLARAAVVSVDATRRALEAFLSPDPDSRTKTDDGRRIEVIDGGWRILNHAKYRQKMTAEEVREKTRDRVSRYRQRNKKALHGVTDVTNNESNDIASAEADTKAEAPPDRSAHARVALGDSKKSEPDPAPEDDGTWKASGCPVDLVSKLDGLGVVRQLAERLGANPVAVRAELDAFVQYWTIGKGAGQQRTGWPGKARQWVIDQNRKPGGLKAPGAVEHEQRSAVSPEIARIAGSILRPI